ncbi:MAG TPA: hypothetical protein VF503_15885 [Sphingobium sp.]|uniref:hypothetical protein n=1 Tax=Sphingobium sp. TaxID=1912891 RepID=UPI002ED3D84C
MIELSEDEWRRAFPMWLRTGRLPSIQKNDAIERKFNPWHDPKDGRFTFGESGHYHGEDKPQSTSRAPKVLSHAIPKKPGTTPQLRSKLPQAEKPNPAAEFAGGVGEGLYSVAEGTVEAVHSALTTNPVTTVRNAGLGVARTIDNAIAAEDTPARVQISRAADAVANASARDIGRATRSVVGNAALVVVPEAALGKVSALRRLGEAVPHTPYDPPQIGWVKENLGRDTPAKRYNDTATGGRTGQAPTLMRTVSDGSQRPVNSTA